MWSRAQLKAKAKYALKLNYWKIVAAAFLFSIIVAGIGSSSGFTYEVENFLEQMEEEESNDDFSPGGYFDSGYFDSGSSDGDYRLDVDDAYLFEYDLDNDFSYSGSASDESEIFVFVVMILLILIIFIIIMVVALGISLLWMAFIGNPVTVGANKFFFKSLNEKAEVKELLSAFDGNYKNIAWIMFYKTLYTMLWTLLFIIPGIVKSYEYRMIPYLLAENPNLTKEQAFAISKQMMNGQKWDAFVLDLSFIGWEILSGLTAGILGIFYVNPYIQMTNAALYEELSLMHGRPALAVAGVNVGNPYQTVNPYAQPAAPGQPEVSTYQPVQDDVNQAAEIDIDININRED